MVIILRLKIQTVQIREFHTSTVFTAFLRMQTIDGFLSIFKEATESMFYHCEHFLNYLCISINGKRKIIVFFFF